MKHQASKDIYNGKKKLIIKEGEWVTIITNRGDVLIIEKANLERFSVNKSNLKGL